MKLFSKISALGVVVALTTAFASADTINSGPTTTNFFASITTATIPSGLYPTPTGFGSLGSGTPTFMLNPGTTWGAALGSSQWVGAAASFGPGAGEVNPAFGYYLYGYTFTTSGTLTSVDVLADDTVAVFVGASDEIINPGALGGDGHCADNAPSCVDTLEGIFNGSVSVTAGERLWFIVEQGGNGPAGLAQGGDPSGVDFVATVNPTVPEPSTLLLLGTGLISSAGALFRRKRI